MRGVAALLALVLLFLVAAGSVWGLRARRRSSEREVPPPVLAAAAAPQVPVRRPAAVVEPWFTTITEGTGIDFRHHSGTNEEKPFPAANGSGIAALDFDLDGWYDLYFATGTPFPLDAGRADPINRCYRNLGSMKFQDVTGPTGLGHNGYSAGLAVGDYDSDGFPDVYVNCFGANVLYHNLGDGCFEAVTEEARVGDDRWGASAAFFDYDGDGLLDLYVCNYAKWTWETRRWCGDRERNIRVHCGPHSVEAELDVLYHNRGNGTFAEVTQEAGLADRAGRAQGVVAADFNRDGLCDLYVTNDLHANSLFINEGTGRFRDATETSGAAYDNKGSMQAGMGVDAADITGDGLPELFVTNFANENNSLYVNMGRELFQEASQSLGVYAEGFPWVGWGTAFADFDLDGAPDLVVSNGHVDDNRHLFGEDSPYAQPPLLWRKNAQRFEFLGEAAGDYFRESHVGRALVVADLDNDGDQDLVVGHQDDSPAVLQNERQGRHTSVPSSFTLRLIGTRSNRDAVGSTITSRRAEPTRMQQIKGGGSYLCSHDLRQIFALSQEGPSGWEIHWPGGEISVMDPVSPGASVIVIEPSEPGRAPQILVREQVDERNP